MIISEKEKERRRKIKEARKWQFMIYRSEETRKKLSKANTGKKLTPETKQKIGKGNKDKKVSKETRNKISENQKMRFRTYLTEEHKQKISNYHKGKVVSPETKQKLSLANRGHFVTEKSKQKMSLSHKGQIPWIKGKQHSEESKQKMSDSHIKRLQEKGVPWKETKPEQEAEKILKKYNIKYKKQKALKYNNRYKVYDFHLSDYNILLEVDGTYWHSKGIKDEDIKSERLKDMRINDKIKDKLAEDNDYTLIRIWEDELFKLEDYCKIIVE